MENQGNQDRFDSLHDQYGGEGKTCTKCLVAKRTVEFDIRRASPDGLAYVCKTCKRAHDKAYRQSPEGKASIKARLQTPEVKEKRKGYGKKDYQKHKTKRKATQKIWNEANKESVLARVYQWQEDNPERRRANARRSSAKFRRENPELAKKRAIEAVNRRLQTVQGRLAFNLRQRLRKVLKGERKGGSAVRDLGCSIEEFKQHLESQWAEGMSWETYGIGAGKWNIDHIMPLFAFDLTDRQHVVLACFYLNLRPMWGNENSSKGAKIGV